MNLSKQQLAKLLIDVELSQQEIAKLLIEELGGTGQVADICQLTPASVSGWKKHGIPISWQKYMLMAYPKLQVWKKLLHKSD